MSDNINYPPRSMYQFRGGQSAKQRKLLVASYLHGGCDPFILCVLAVDDKT
jgi:hypothetical protein